MVAQYKEGLSRNCDLLKRALVCVVSRYVILFDRAVVQKNLAVINADAVPCNTDDALDVTFRRITRIAKHHNVAALNRSKPVDKLVDEDAFLIIQRGHHAGAFYLYRLIQE